MLAATMISCLLTFQEPSFLEVNGSVTGRITPDSKPVELLIQERNLEGKSALGELHQIKVANSGKFTIEVVSYDFDSYLVVADEKGESIAEDDNGLLITHARLTIDLQADTIYQVWACALGGGAGVYGIRFVEGAPKTFSPEERKRLEYADCINRVRNIKNKNGADTEIYFDALNLLGKHFQRYEEYEKAQEQWGKVLEGYERVLGKDHLKVADVLNRRALTYYQNQGQHEAARGYLERAIEIARSQAGGESLKVATYSMNLGNLLGRMGRGAEGIPYAEKAVEIRSKIFGEVHSQTAHALGILAIVHHRSDSSPKAAEYYQRQLAVLQAIHGNKSPEILNCLINLSQVLVAVNRFADADDHFALALDICIQEHGDFHLTTARCMRAIAELRYEQGHYAEALETFEKVVSIQSEILGDKHPKLATSLGNMSNVYLTIGKHAEASEILGRVLEIYMESLGTSSIQTITAQANYALSLQRAQQLDEASTAYATAIQWLEDSRGLRNSTGGILLANHSTLLQSRGNLAEAIPLLESAISIFEELLGKEHLNVGLSLINLSSMLSALGEVEEARVLLERAIVILESAYGSDHPQVALAQDNLGTLLLKTGDFEQALVCYHKSLGVKLSAYGESSPKVASSYLNLGRALVRLERMEEAESYFHDAVRIMEGEYGKGDPATAGALQGLANFLMLRGHYQEALGLSDQGLAIRIAALGRSHPLTLEAMARKASILNRLEMLEEARLLLIEVLDSNMAIFGADHPETLLASQNLAVLLTRSQEYEEAAALLIPAVTGMLDILDREIATMPEADRILYLESEIQLDPILHCLEELGPSRAHEVYPLLLRWKGVASRAQAAALQLRNQLVDSDTRKLVGRIQVLAGELSSLVLLPTSQREADHAVQIATRRKERLELERNLNRQIKLQEIPAVPSIPEIQNSLSKKSAFVDFYVSKYVLAVVTRHDGQAKPVNLGLAKDLKAEQEDMLRRYAVRGGRALEAKKSASQAKFFNSLWLPLKEAIGNAEMLLICPDDFLCELPFGLLQFQDGEYLLEKYRVFYLSDSTQLLPGDDVRHEVEGQILGIGGVDYFERDGFAEVVGHRGVNSSRVNAFWGSIPATRREVQHLNDLHQHVLKWEAPFTRVEGAAATEEKVRAELPGKRYIHIATHGYFEPEGLPSLQLDAELQGGAADVSEQARAVGLLPGMLTGLVFAGVNGEPDPERHDGYLSAEEIQHIDLSDCELVVLSACETALGSSRAGEGLMSLRRAFAVAGADTVVSSLWKVDDEITASLMKDFYTNLWQKRMSRGEALHQAKLKLLRLNRIQQNGDALPSTWGAFVLSGKWN